MTVFPSTKHASGQAYNRPSSPGSGTLVSTRDNMAAPVSTKPSLSVVLTISNQRHAIRARYDEICAACAALDFEIIAVDDGSIDGGIAVLRELAANDPRLRVVRLRRSFGRSAALTAGFERARAEVIVAVDAGVQLEPQDVHNLRHAIAGGYDVANGTRAHTGSTARLGSRLISAATGITMADYGSPLKAYRSTIARELRLYGNLHRFIPAIAYWQGGKITEVPVISQAAPGASRKTSVWGSLGLLLDMITMRFMLNYAHRPMQSIGRIGGALLAVALALFAYLGVVKFGFGQDIGNRPLLLLAVLLGAISVQVLVLGLLAELMIRVYYEVQNKPIYAIREIINADARDVATSGRS